MLSKIEAKNSEITVGEELRHKVSFNGQTGVIRFGDVLHKFQRGTRGDKDRLLMLKKLWDTKRFFKNGIEKMQGKPLAPEFLAVQLNLTGDASNFNRNETVKNKLFGLIKGTNRILKDKGFPVNIERKNGIQLIITEK